MRLDQLACVQIRNFWWKAEASSAIVSAAAGLHGSLRCEYGRAFYRPGPMQAEPVNLVRRGTEQP